MRKIGLNREGVTIKDKDWPVDITSFFDRNLTWTPDIYLIHRLAHDIKRILTVFDGGLLRYPLALIEMNSKFALLKYEREMEVLSMWIWDASRPKPVRQTMKWISEIRTHGNNRWVINMTNSVQIVIKCQFSNKKFGSNSVCRQCCYVDNCFNAYGLEGNIPAKLTVGACPTGSVKKYNQFYI